VTAAPNPELLHAAGSAAAHRAEQIAAAIGTGLDALEELRPWQRPLVRLLIRHLRHRERAARAESATLLAAAVAHYREDADIAAAIDLRRREVDFEATLALELRERAALARDIA
jgi:hypothetical protein